MRLVLGLLIFGCWLAFPAGVLAQSAELFLFEPNLSRVVGYGVTSGTEFKVNLSRYSGNVTALWLRDTKKLSFQGSINAGHVHLTVPGQGVVDLNSFLLGRGLSDLKVSVTVAPLAAPTPKPVSGAAAPAGSSGGPNSNPTPNNPGSPSQPAPSQPAPSQPAPSPGATPPSTLGESQGDKERREKEAEARKQEEERKQEAEKKKEEEKRKKEKSEEEAKKKKEKDEEEAKKKAEEEKKKKEEEEKKPKK